MLIIRKVHISLLAMPRFLTGPGRSPRLRSSSSLESSSIAFSPAGVAAHPSPRTLAIMFAVIGSTAGCPAGREGKRKRMRGFIFREALLMISAFAAISIRPTQKDMTPIIVMHKVTASLEESSAALVISGMRPVNAAKMMPTRIMPAHK